MSKKTLPTLLSLDWAFNKSNGKPDTKICLALLAVTKKKKKKILFFIQDSNYTTVSKEEKLLRWQGLIPQIEAQQKTILKFSINKKIVALILWIKSKAIQKLKDSKKFEFEETQKEQEKIVKRNYERKTTNKNTSTPKKHKPYKRYNR